MAQRLRVPSSSSEVQRLKQELKLLQERIAHLEGEVETLSNFLENTSAASQVVVLRELGREEAKREIRELFAAGEVLYYSDISRRLGIELPLVVELCQELLEDQEITIHANDAHRSR